MADAEDAVAGKDPAAAAAAAAARMDLTRAMYSSGDRMVVGFPSAPNEGDDRDAEGDNFNADNDADADEVDDEMGVSDDDEVGVMTALPFADDGGETTPPKRESLARRRNTAASM